MTTAPQGTAARRVDSSHVGKDRGNLFGILVMQVAMLFFVTNDTLTKLAGADLAVGQIVVARGLIAVVSLSIICFLLGEFRNIRQAFHSAVMMRSVCEAAVALFFLAALPHIPLANISAIMLTIPLATIFAAALVLREQVGIRRWTAVLVGLLGVVAIVRPGLDGFNFYTIYALVAVLLASGRDLVTRSIPKGFSIWIITLMTMTISTIAGMGFGLTEDWAPISLQNYLLLAGAAFCLTVGQYFLVIAMNNGEISVVSSFRYIAILISLMYGYLLWGDIPDPLTWFGIILILGSGIYSIFRERQLAMKARSVQMNT